MASEHLDKGGSDYTFEATNYRITTTASKEWAFVQGSEKPDPDQMNFGRRIPRVEDLLRSPMTKKAGLAVYEVAALILYSGPMVRYLNTISSIQLFLERLLF